VNYSSTSENKIFQMHFKILQEVATTFVNPLNAKLNPICHLLALLGDHHILHISRIRVKLNDHGNYLSIFHLMHLQYHFFSCNKTLFLFCQILHVLFN